jgi:glycine oxidase
VERQADVIVIGAGIVGMATALFLSRAGAAVTVLERDAIACGASGAAAGILSTFSPVARPPAYEALAQEGLRLHRVLASELRNATGADVRFAPLTILYPAFTASEARELRLQALPATAAAGSIVRWLEAEEAHAAEPRLSRRALGALAVTEQARVDAYRLTVALAQAAEQRGVTIRYAEVTGLTTEQRRVTGVRLGGSVVRARQVVLAGGPWTGLMAPWVGQPLPVTPLRGQILRLQAGEPPLRTCIMYGKNYLLDKGDGLTVVGTTEEAVGFRPRPTRGGRAAVLAAVLKLAPSLGEAAVVQHTACLRPLSADGMPLIGTVPGIDGLVVAAGHGRQGILLGPITGQLAAALALGMPPLLSLTDFAPGRFRTLAG